MTQLSRCKPIFFPKIQSTLLSNAPSITLAYIVLLSGFLFSCDTNPVKNNSEPGRFNLIWLKGLQKASSQIEFQDLPQIQAIDFQLGEIEGSRNFFFILTNAGDKVIRDVEITSSNSSFLAYPSRIDSLIPSRNLDLTEVNEINLLRITVIHGKNINDNTFAPLMKPGFNETQLDITGKTNDENGISETTTLHAGMSVEAHLMDVTIWDGTKEVDLLKSDGSVLVGGFVIQDFIKFYEVADTVRFENTGNVPIKFTVFRNNHIDTLEVGQTFVLGFRQTSHSRFESGGVVRDVARLPAYSDGNTYIHLRWIAN